MRSGLVLVALIFTVAVGALAQTRFDSIRQQGTIRICADPDNLPFSSSDAATPGFEVELARLIAHELGVEARLYWHPTRVQALTPLRDGACDLFMGLPKDKSLAEGLPWIAVSQPYYVMRHAIVARADSGINTLTALADKRVAVDAASVADFYLLELGLQRGIYKGQQKAFNAVVSGEAPAALLWLPVASWMARSTSELRVIPLSDPRLEVQIGAGVRRRYRELANAIDEAVGQLQARGDVQDILVRYGAIPNLPARQESPAAVREQMQGSAAEGKSVYATVCSRCHGAGGLAGGPGGVPTIRHYAKGKEHFVDIVQHGKKGTAMAPFKNILTMQEILSVYAYLTSLPHP